MGDVLFVGELYLGEELADRNRSHFNRVAVVALACNDLSLQL
jgi:hypothetical protein